MKTFYRLLFLSTLGFALAACNQQVGQYPVGIIDLDRISQETGHTDIAKEKLNELRSGLQKDLSDTQSRMQNDMQDAQKKMGEKPTKEQQSEMRQMATKMQTEIMQKQTKATHALQSKQAELITAFRNNVRAVADRVAQQRGMHIVLLRNPAVLLGNDKSVDITDAVLEEMNKAGGDAKPTETDETPVKE